MCEFAPGSPWNTMVLLRFGCLLMGCCYVKPFSLSLARQHRARLLQLLRTVDAERHRVDQRDVYAHAGLERAQLLELLPPLQRRGREPHEPLERLAPVGI